jgi:nicotinate-nucleotide adenylyltransferase
MKVGILGGSFDPIHVEHVLLIKEAIKQLHLDSFMVIPTKHNPWKDSNAATKEQRFDMLGLSLSDLENTSINTIEMDSDSEDKNYTIDTLQTLVKQYPNNQFYYIMGMDQASQFDKWKGAKEISTLVQLVAFKRLGYLENENLTNYHFITLQNIPTSISSSAIRNGDVSFLDPKVLSYISNHGLYLETMLASVMSKKRFIHTKSMAYVAKDIALANGLDAHKAYIAGMFHDIAKEMPEKKARRLMEKYFPMYLDKPIAVWHQWLSALIANKKYLLEDSAILQAIRHHTTASVGMTPFDMCIYVADKYDPSREYDSQKEIALCKENIMLGFKECLKHFYAYAKEENREIDASFYEVYSKFTEEKLDE